MSKDSKQTKVIKSYDDFLRIYLPNRKKESETNKEESFGEILAREFLRNVSKKLSES